VQRRPFVFLIGLSAIAALAIGAAGAALGQAPSSRPVVYPPEPAAAAAHVARARQIAGTDPALRIMSDGYACMSPEGIARFRAALDRGGEDQPVQLFDNLYMFGTRSVNSLVLRTSDGLIMWDALNNEQDARTIIEPGMRKFGSILRTSDCSSSPMLMAITSAGPSTFRIDIRCLWHPVTLTGPPWNGRADPFRRRCATEC
jgi:metallo-beta-lactamase class B